jgi:predicted HNH restriction endonuclease
LIHVHHERPLSTIGAAYEGAPIADLEPVCANCHAIIHRRPPAYTIEEVRAMLRQSSQAFLRHLTIQWSGRATACVFGGG